MNKVIFYDGLIKNIEELGRQLNICTCSKDKKIHEKEILLKCYEKWGEDIASHLKGYFSFCIYDMSRNLYFGARDGIGIVPFYYIFDNINGFACDVRINKLLQNSKKKLNERALQIYLSLTYLPGEETFYKDVYKLMPGHIMIVKDGCKHIKEIEKEHVDLYKKSFDEAIIELGRLIDNSINETYSEDFKRKGFLLSSGIDSNYLFTKSNVKNAFAIGFVNEKCDESMEVVRYCNDIKRNCENYMVSPQIFFNSIREGVQNLEQPLGTAASYMFMIGCRNLMNKVDILYTGEGADELFAGYDIYQNYPLY